MRCGDKMEEIIYGKNTVIETIKANHKVNELYISDHLLKKEKDFISLLEKKRIRYSVKNKNELNQLTNNANHQGVVAKIEPYKYYELEDLLKYAQTKNEAPFILILDGLEDPHNLGAMMRTADACGVHGIVIPKNRSVGLNSTLCYCQ